MTNSPYFTLRNITLLCMFLAYTLLLKKYYISYSYFDDHPYIISIPVVLISIIMIAALKDTLLYRLMAFAVLIRAILSILLGTDSFKSLRYGISENVILLTILYSTFDLLVIIPLIIAYLKSKDKEDTIKYMLWIPISFVFIVPLFNGLLGYIGINSVYLQFFFDYIPLLLFFGSLAIYFFLSFRGSTDEINKYLSIGGILTSIYVTYFYVRIKFMLYYDSYEINFYDDSYSWYDFKEDSIWIIILAGIVLISYFGYLLYRSKGKFNKMCVGGILASISLVLTTLIEHSDGKLFTIVTMGLFTYTFYQFNKLLSNE